jgi:hypothetical protein
MLPVVMLLVALSVMSPLLPFSEKEYRMPAVVSIAPVVLVREILPPFLTSPSVPTLLERISAVVMSLRALSVIAPPLPNVVPASRLPALVLIAPAVLVREILPPFPHTSISYQSRYIASGDVVLSLKGDSPPLPIVKRKRVDVTCSNAASGIERDVAAITIFRKGI